jgi:hypothetical protein
MFGIYFNFVKTGAGNKRFHLFKLEGNKMPFAFHILRKPFTVASSKLFATVAIFYSFASLVPCHILNFLQTSTNHITLCSETFDMGCGLEEALETPLASISFTFCL